MLMKNEYPGVLTMPDGVDVKPGETVEISDAMAENAGVAEWIAGSWLSVVVEDKPKGK